jgi:catalase
MSNDKKLTTNGGYPVADNQNVMAADPLEIQLRHIGNCLKADPEYGKGFAKALGIPAA